jgi:DNA-binding transcriptional ArsR family regulator
VTRPELEGASELFKALSAPLRIAILEALDSRGPLFVHQLVELTAASQSLVSQHLRVLRAAHLVRGHRQGKEIAYEISDDHVAHIVRDALVHAREP